MGTDPRVSTGLEPDEKKGVFPLLVWVPGFETGTPVKEGPTPTSRRRPVKATHGCMVRLERYFGPAGKEDEDDPY